MLSMPPSIALVSLSIVSNTVLAVADSEKQSIPLPLPDINISESNNEPVEYLVQPPGEFKDVDLPDEVKKTKYFYMASQGDDKTSNADANKYSRYSIQVAMFKNYDNAVRMMRDLAAHHLRVEIIEKTNSRGEMRYFVRVGHYESYQQAQDALDLYNKTANYKALIVKE